MASKKSEIVYYISTKTKFFVKYNNHAYEHIDTKAKVLPAKYISLLKVLDKSSVGIRLNTENSWGWQGPSLQKFTH